MRVLSLSLFLSALMALSLNQPQAFAQSTEALNDGNFLHILIAANNGEVKLSNLAMVKSSNDQVKAFAQKEITDHTAVNSEASNIIANDSLVAEESNFSLKLKADVTRDILALQQLQGAAFDLKYIEIQIAAHKKMLKVLDSLLIPNVVNANLKNLFLKSRPVVISHLEEAQNILATLTQ